MAKVPLTNVSLQDIRNAVISVGASVPATNYGLAELIAPVEVKFEDFDPAYLDGATSKADIKGIGQWRGFPRTKYGNVEMSQSFTKQCSGDGEGSSHLYTVPADTYFSYDGQTEANALAAADIAANGQAYADSHPSGFCTWYNDEMSDTFTRDNCGYKGVGSSFYHTLPARSVSSVISKAQANSLGHDLLVSQGQSWINANGYCTWYSEARSASIQRDNCEEGYEGSYVTVNASEDQFSSVISLDEANDARDSWMQGQANANGTCTLDCVAPHRPLSVTYSSLGDFTEYIGGVPYGYTVYEFEYHDDSFVHPVHGTIGLFAEPEFTPVSGSMSPVYLGGYAFKVYNSSSANFRARYYYSIEGKTCYSTYSDDILVVNSKPEL